MEQSKIIDTLETYQFTMFASSGQGSKLNDVLGFDFVVYITCHPLKDPSLRISIVATNVKSGIKLEHQLFIPVLLVGDERQQSRLFEAIQIFFQAR